MNLDTFDVWYQHFVSSLDELGTFFEEDDISLSFLIFDHSVVKKWTDDLSELIKISRKLSIDNVGSTIYLPGAQRELCELYKEKEWSPFIARPDAIVQNGQLKIIELNFDSSSIEGLYEIDYIQSQLSTNPLINEKLNYYSAKYEFVKFIDNLLSHNIDINEVNKNIVIVIDSDMSRYDKDIAEATSCWINENTNIKCTIRMQEMLWVRNNFVTDGELKYAALYIYTTLMDAEHVNSSLIELLKDAIHTNTLILSDPKDISVDCKDSLCLLHEYANNGDDSCTKEERLLINEYIPWSFRVCKKGVTIKDGLTHNIEDILIQNKNNFILKRMHSFYGKHIIKGCLYPQTEWEDSVYKALESSNTWMAQECVESDTFCMKYYDFQNKKFYSKYRKIVLGPYMYGEGVANFLVRVEKDSRNPILRRLTDGNMGLAFVATRN